MYSAYEAPINQENNQPLATGWIPPFPDLRDYSDDTPEITSLAKSLGLTSRRSARATPGKVDLRKWCSPVEDQQSIGSCTANAGVGIVEYFERRAFGNYLNGSRLFLYKATRNLMGVTGDTGAWLRNTMGAMALLGVPPEKYWPYKISDYDKEPTSFVYGLGDNFEALRYFCHDPLSSNKSPAQVLLSIKRYIAAGIPSMFGFYGFPSFNKTTAKGEIPFPCPGENAIWGHAVVAIGYDNNLKITNPNCRKATKGAFIIRNSWGSGWGDGGYGYLPYQYLLSGFALDFWSLFSMGWVSTKNFGI